jgi:hypothetical protein
MRKRNVVFETFRRRGSTDVFCTVRNFHSGTPVRTATLAEVIRRCGRYNVVMHKDLGELDEKASVRA